MGPARLTAVMMSLLESLFSLIAHRCSTHWKKIGTECPIQLTNNLIQKPPSGEPKRVISPWSKHYPRTREDEVLNRTITYPHPYMRINLGGKNTTGWFNLALQRKKSSAGSQFDATVS